MSAFQENLKYSVYSSQVISSGFVFFWGCVFIVSTTLVWIFKKEVDHSQMANADLPEEEKEHDLGIVETYSILWKIIRLKPMVWMLVILLTGKVTSFQQEMR